MAIVFVAAEGTDRRVVYSASDLAAAARCEYALLRSFDARLGWGPDVSSDDELLARTAQLGDEHEQRHLDELRATDQDENVVVIGRPAYTLAGLSAAAEATREAVESSRARHLPGGHVRRPVRRLRRLPGARSLVRTATATGSATPSSPARSRSRRCCNSPRTPTPWPGPGSRSRREVELVLGDGAVASYRTDELLPVYRPRREALERLLDGHLAGGAAVSWEDPEVRACFRCPECELQVRAHDDLLLVAGMRVSQRARLIDAGVSTVHELAGHTGAVPELSARTVKALTAQARLQVADRVDGKPPYEVVDAQPLMVLPDANKGDLFFDFEGDPLWTVDGREWGLEYLWGVLTTTDEFTPYWAHDRASERQALVDFLAMVRKRLKKHPGMHVYHYAAYEKSTLLRLAGRYGVGEHDVDELLRNGVLVDLYPLVRKSIRVGTESYSIKYLEPLYMGNELRSGEVTTATDSITQYARFCALRDEGRTDDAAIVLKEIEDYNRYDCRSTRRLRDWLMARAIESGVPPRGPHAGARRRRRRAGRRARTPTAQVRGRRHRGTHRRADRRRDDRGRPRLSQARGQAVLVGALRPRQQSRRRVGGQQRRLRRRAGRDRRRLAPAAEGAQAAAPRPVDRRTRQRRTRQGACTRSTTRPRRKASPTTRIAGRSER